MRIFIIILIFVSISSDVFAFDIDFQDRKETTARQACFLFMLLIDREQTSNIDNRIKYHIDGGKGFKTKHSEKNKILGKYPNQTDIDLYFISCAVLHTTISYMLSEKYSKIWQCVWIGVESKTLTNNYHQQNTKPNLEYKIEFKFEF